VTEKEVVEEEDDILDTYLDTVQKTASAGPVAASSKNTGHRLLCPVCRSFQRTVVTYVAESQTLQVKCKACETVEDFVLHGVQGFAPKSFLERMRGFSRKRFVETFLGGRGEDASH